MRLNAPYHSIYLGIPFSAPSSIKSKSRTRLRAATPTIKIDTPILIGEFEVRKLNVEPKKLITKLTRYKSNIPPIADTSISLKFCVGRIRPDL
jgi:hypothetical protein